MSDNEKNINPRIPPNAVKRPIYKSPEEKNAHETRSENPQANAEEKAEAQSENPWAELQRTLEEMEKSYNSTSENTDAPEAPEAAKSSGTTESKSGKTDLNRYIKRSETMVEEATNMLKQSLLDLTDTLAEKGLLDKKTARKHRKRVKREAKLRQREIKRKLKEEARKIRKNGSL